MMELKLLKVEAFRTHDNIALPSAQLLFFPFEPLDASGASENGGAGASYTFIFTVVISFGVSVLTGGSMELMWSLANTLQILFFFSLLSLHFTTDLKTVFSFMSYSNFSNPLTEYITEKVFISFNLINIAVTDQFDGIGLSSTNILVNAMDKIVMVFLLIVTAIILAILASLLKSKANWYAKLIKKVDKAIRYESLTRFIVELSLNLTVTALINITYGETSTMMGVSYVIAILVLLTLLFMLFYAFIYPIKHFKKIGIYPDYHERH